MNNSEYNTAGGGGGDCDWQASHPRRSRNVPSHLVLQKSKQAPAAVTTWPDADLIYSYIILLHLLLSKMTMVPTTASLRKPRHQLFY